jgi:hypothetical protein
MRRSTVLILCAAAVIAAGPAFAAPPDKKLTWNVGGGATFPLSDAGDKLNTGGNFGLGITYNITDVFGIQFEPMYNYMSAKDNAITNVTGLDANLQVWQFDFNLVLRTKPDKRVGAYLIFGGGFYNVKGEITQATVTGGIVCDPFWGVCFPVVVPGEQVLGSRSVTKGGIDVGGGFTIRMGEHSRFYIETRYHYVWLGPLGAGATPYSSGDSVNLQYLPLTFGFRF